MGFYVTSPFKPTPTLLVQGRPEYVFGSLNDKTGPTLGFVISDSGNGTTSTVVFQIQSGNVPLIGSFVTIVGTANAAGAYNATNAQILTVVTTEQGVCTITFSGTGTSSSAQDAGSVQIPQVEIGDALTTAGGSSVPVVCPDSPSQQSGKSLSVTVSLPSQQGGVSSTLSAVTVVIQGSNVDKDDHYNTIGTITPTSGVAAGTVTDWQSGQGYSATASNTPALGNVNLPNFRFYRLSVTAATGSGPIVGSIMM
jgi:hypothetical protein